MQFLSPLYGLFLLGVVGLWESLRKAESRAWLILLSSVIFYASLQAQYLLLLAIGTLVTFYLGHAIAAAPNWRLPNQASAQAAWHHRRRQLLWIAIGCNLLFLIGFKYLPFLVSTIGLATNWAAAIQGSDWLKTNLLAPLGLSFFCFEAIAYLVDIYRGAPAEKDLIRFAAYKLFFAKLISGPIVRYQDFNSQLDRDQGLTFDTVLEGVWLIACGAVKKGIIADRLSVFINLSFDNVSRSGSGDLWLAIFAYGLQLYLDFSGYVDVARGSALLLGIELPKNFNFPYLATSIADFWRRWHITLGAWLRNYLYFPLGGSRQGLGRTCLNLMVVMVLAGIWHGAAWGFILWGGLHGLALVVHRLVDRLSQQVTLLTWFWQTGLGVLLGWGLTQSMVLLTWIFFRLPNVKEVWRVLNHLWGKTADVQYIQKVYGEVIGLYPAQIAVALGAIGLGMGVAYFFQDKLRLSLAWYVKLLLIPIFLYGVWQLAPEGATGYIYFDF